MTVLITGATGYLGSQLLGELLKSDVRVIVVKRRSSSLTRIQAFLGKLAAIHDVEDGFDPIFIKNSVDGIIHCATDYGRKKTDPLQIVQANLIFPLALLEAAAQAKVRFFVNTDTLLDEKINDYSLSKKQFTEWLKLFGKRMVCVNLALEHFFGPGDDKSKFITWLIESILSGAPSLPLTQGEQRRDFIFIDDVVRAFVTVLGKIQTFENGFYEFEVGTGKSISVRDVVMSISNLLSPHSTRLDFGRQAYRENEVMDSVVNIAPLVALGWKSKVNFVEGIEATVSSCRQSRSL